MHDSPDNLEFKSVSLEKEHVNLSLNPSYTIPGVVHFLEHQWTKFESEKAQWEIEKAELQNKINFLQGERKSQENLKKSMSRRIKMLEHALIQERSQNNDNLNNELTDNIDDFSLINNYELPLKQGKNILEQYLKEIGCTDLIIDIKTQKMKSLVALGSDNYELINQHQQNLNNHDHNEKTHLINHLNGDNYIIHNVINENKYNIDQKFDLDHQESQSPIFKHEVDNNIQNENVHGVEIENDKNSKTWHLQATLKGHLDGIKCIAFHPVLPTLLSGSEDGTIKYWSLDNHHQQPNTVVDSSSSSSISKKLHDNEAIATLIYHKGPVLCLAFLPNGSHFVSGGFDGQIALWETPPPDYDQYEDEGKYDGLPHNSLVDAHKDVVWCLKCNLKNNIIYSCSADGSLLILEFSLLQSDDSYNTKANIINRIYPPDTKNGVIDSATSCDILPNHDQVVVSYTSGRIIVYDGSVNYELVISFQCDDHYTSIMNINMIVCHPTLPVIATCHGDKYIRFFDTKTGKCIDKIMAHLDAVTCLSFDPYGIFFITGSHDNSLRLWNFESKNCIQEITCHKKKFDEGINSVVFHPSLSYMASGGADSIIKIFVLL